MFRVVYGEPCGVEPPMENGRRVLVIPPNGQLIIKPAFEAGIIDHAYYLVDGQGVRTPIARIQDYRGRAASMPGVLVGGSGIMGGPMPDGGWSTASPLAIEHTDLYLFNTDTVIPERSEQRSSEITQALVRDCRERK